MPLPSSHFPLSNATPHTLSIAGDRRRPLQNRSEPSGRVGGICGWGSFRDAPRAAAAAPPWQRRARSHAQGTCGHCPDPFAAGCARWTGRAHRSCSPGRSQVRPARAAPKGRPRPRLCMPCTQGMFGQPTDMLGAGGRSDFKELNVPPQLQPKISENVV